MFITAVLPYRSRFTEQNETYLTAELDELILSVISTETSSDVQLKEQVRLDPFLYTGREWFVCMSDH
jgi:type VI protein secretion system component Hcp